MTSEQPAQSQPQPLGYTVALDSFDSILAAGRGEATRRWKHRRDAGPVEYYGEDEQAFHLGAVVDGEEASASVAGLLSSAAASATRVSRRLTEESTLS